MRDLTPLLIHLLITIIIILTNRSQPAIPDQKIQAIIAFKMLVMSIVIDRSIDPSSYEMLVKPFGVQLIAQMPIYVVGNHKSQKSEQGSSVIRNQPNNEKNNGSFNHRFQRMKSISCPRGRVGGFVMYLVKIIK